MILDASTLGNATSKKGTRLKVFVRKADTQAKFLFDRQ